MEIRGSGKWWATALVCTGMVTAVLGYDDYQVRRELRRERERAAAVGQELERAAAMGPEIERLITQMNQMAEEIRADPVMQVMRRVAKEKQPEIEARMREMEREQAAGGQPAE